MLISPRTTFQNCGSSSKESLRRIRPVRVIRESPTFTANPAPIVSAPTTIVRSFRSSKSTPSLPTRVCRKKTGPPPSSLIASAAKPITGDATTSATPPITTSAARFTPLPPAMESCPKKPRPVAGTGRVPKRQATWWAGKRRRSPRPRTCPKEPRPVAGTGRDRRGHVSCDALLARRRPRGGNAAPHVVPERDDGRPRNEDVVPRDADAREERGEQTELEPERHHIDHAVAEQRDRAREKNEVEHAARVAEMPMRDQRDAVPKRLAAEHPAAQDDEPAVLEHPHLAAVLRLVRRRRPLGGACLGLVHRAHPTLRHEVRERKVVAEARVDLDVVRAPQRVDRAVAPGDRAEPRLRCAREELVPPVHALLIPAVDGLELEPPADVRDLRVCEVADELPQRVRRPGRIRVGKGDDLRVGCTHGRILRCDLAAPRVADHPRSRRCRELLRTVGRRIRGDDDLDELLRIVELAKVR